MEGRRKKANRKSVPTKLQNGSHAGSVITLEMETTSPVSELQRIVGSKLNSKDFGNYEIYLQDIKLNPIYSIYDQAIRVSGSVELKVQVESNSSGSGRLTIVEIAKNMTDEEIRALEEVEECRGNTRAISQGTRKLPINELSESEKEEDLGLPRDPTLWTQDQLHSWMLHIAKGYHIDPLLIKKPGMDGKRLCSLPIEDFFIKFPYGNIFWSHLTYLRKLSSPDVNDNDMHVGTEDTALNLVINDRHNKTPSGVDQATVTVQITHETSSTDQSSFLEKSTTSAKVPHSSSRSHTGGGQIQLWQFLLELLTDADERHVITWVGDDGGFKFLDPEKVAQKWGERKGKPAMNYEKLSRALRYYYDGDMISKVSGKRFEYKFVCNLKEILGYNAAELHEMVVECYEKRQVQKNASVEVFGRMSGVIQNSTGAYISS